MMRAIFGKRGPDGDTPDDTFVCRTLRTYYAEEKLSKKYPYWPDWMPGPRPADMPAKMQGSTVESSNGVNEKAGQRDYIAQDARSDSYLQHGADARNGSSQQVSSVANQGLKSLWSDDGKPATAAAQSGRASLKKTFNKRPQRPQQPEVEPRPIPSQRDYSQQGRPQGRPQDQQSHSASANYDAYNSNDSRTGRGGYDSKGTPTNGYGSGNSRSAQGQPSMTANAPWSSGASKTSNGGYMEPRGYEDPPSRSTPNSLRTGRGLSGGLPSNPRGNR